MNKEEKVNLLQKQKKELQEQMAKNFDEVLANLSFDSSGKSEISKEVGTPMMLKADFLSIQLGEVNYALKCLGEID